MNNKTFTVKGIVQIYSGNQMENNEVNPIIKILKDINLEISLILYPK